MLALAGPLLLFPGPWSLASLGAIGATWLARRQARGAWTVRTYLDGPARVLLLMLVPALLVSVDRAPGWNRATVLLLGIAVFYGLANGIATERQALQVGLALIPIGVLAALASLVGTDWQVGALAGLPQPAWIYSHLPRLLTHIPGSGVPPLTDLFHPRIVAGTMAFLLPLPLAFLLRGRDRRGRLLCAGAVALMGATLLLTQAPQGLLGLAVGGLVLAAPLLRRRPWLPALGLALGVGAALSIALLPPPLQGRLLFGITGRLEIWREAVTMLRDMPFTGIGLNTFPLISDRFYTLVPDQMPHAHNTYLQTAVDFGLPGLLAFLALLVGFARATWRAYRGAADPAARTLVLGLAAGVAALLAFGLGDVLGLGYKPATALWVMLGLVAALERIVQHGDTETRRRGWGFATATDLSLGPSPAREGEIRGPLRARGGSRTSLLITPFPGTEEGRRVRFAWIACGVLVLAALPLLGSAAALNAASVLAHRAEMAPGGAVPPAALALAGQAGAWFPANSRAYYLLGLAANEQGQPAQAARELTTALRLDPGDPLAHYQLGWAEYALGDLAAAMHEWRVADGGRDRRSFRPVVAVLWRDAGAQAAAGRPATAVRLYVAALALDLTP